MNYAQRIAHALFHAGALKASADSTNLSDLPDELDRVAATIEAEAPLEDQDFLAWLRQQAIESGLPEAEICAKAWHLASGRAEDFSVMCKSYAAPFTKTVAEGVAHIRREMERGAAERAKFKREQADKLLAEAAELDGRAA